ADVSAGIRSWQSEMLAIPACAADDITCGRFACTLRGFERTWRCAVGGRQIFDAPIMRQIQQPPRVVIESRSLRAGCIRAQKAPTRVKRTSAIVRAVNCSGGRLANGGQEKE